jgi:hypothetical protein
VYSPEYEIRVRHEVGDALEHASGLKHKCRKGHFGQVHPNSCPGVRTEALTRNTQHAPELGYQRKNDRSFILVAISRISIKDDHGSK